MNPLIIALIAFGCIFGGALLGMFLQKFLPEHHLKPESKDAVKLGAALIATMAALVLGILVGSAKSSFDGINASITQGGTKFILLDRVLAQYGPETDSMRPELRASVEKIADHLWPDKRVTKDLAPSNSVSASLETLSEHIRNLTPKTPSQTFLHTQAVQLANQLMEYRWLVLEQEQNTLPSFFLVVLVFWLTTLNLTYGIFAPRNGTVVMVFFSCALSVAAALFIIMEMDRPLEGFIRIPATPFRQTLQYMGQ